MSSISRRDGLKYGARYVAGWVMMADAQYLYWLVRRPAEGKQTGVSNGLSSAFMMLAQPKTDPMASCMQ
jgi:hypothetical protein